ncbi:phage tail tape measure protein [Bacillus tianshenii]|nr:phage tail tape measure protein [Bacillus tianshenii]
MIELFDLVGRIVIEHAGAIREIGRIESRAAQAAESVGRSFNELGNKFNDIGQNFQDVGGNLAAGITAPIVGIGGLAVSAAMEYENLVADIQAQTGVVKAEAESLAKSVQNVFYEGFGESQEQVANALITTKQLFKDIKDEAELEEITRNAVMLEQKFDQDINSTLRAAKQLMTTFGDDSKKAFDMMTYAIQNGADFSDELMDSISEYAPQFKALGYTSEEMMNIFVKGAEKGVWSLDKLGDTAKETFLLIGEEGRKDSIEALEALGLPAEKVMEQIRSGGEESNAAFATVMASLAAIEDQAERDALAIALMGTPLEDLGPEFTTFFAEVQGGLEGYEGAADKAGEAIKEAFPARMRRVIGDAKEALIPLGEVLLDIAEQWLPVISEKIQLLSGWFNSLTSEQQKNIVKWGAFAAAIGPLLMIIGTLAGSIGNIFTLFSILSQFMGGIPSVIGKVIGAFSKAGGAASKFGQIIGKTPSVLGNVFGIFGRLSGFLARFAGMLIPLLTNPWTIAIALIVGAVVGLVVLVVRNWNKISRATQRLGNRFRRFANDVGRALANAANNVRRKFQQMLNIIGSFSGKFFQKGAEVVNGLVKGIQSKVKAAREAISDVADNVMGFFKKKLGIASPSKVFVEYGGFLGEGLEVGMTRYLPKIGQAAEKMANATELSNLAIPSIIDKGKQRGQVMRSNIGRETNPTKNTGPVTKTFIGGQQGETIKIENLYLNVKNVADVDSIEKLRKNIQTYASQDFFNYAIRKL